MDATVLLQTLNSETLEAETDGIEVLDQDVVTLGTQPWFAKRVMVRLKDLLIVYQVTNARTRTHT